MSNLQNDVNNMRALVWPSDPPRSHQFIIPVSGKYSFIDRRIRRTKRKKKKGNTNNGRTMATMLHRHYRLITSPFQNIRYFSSDLNFRGNAVFFDPLRKCSRCRAITGGSGGGGISAVRCCTTTTTDGRGWWEEWWGIPPPASSSSSSPSISLSDVLWPSAGAFAAMALLGRLDQMMAHKGLSITVAPMGAVCAVLFATPTAPGARKYNMFMAQIGCAAFGVLALSIFGPGWLARSAALAASTAFMITTRAIHPPAASLPILFIDGAKYHRLHFWYALFPGATGCILLCLIQEMVSYLKANYKF